MLVDVDATRAEALPRGRPIEVNRVVIQKGDERQLAFYWYHERGRVIASEYASRVFLMLDAARYGRTDGALVRRPDACRLRRGRCGPVGVTADRVRPNHLSAAQQLPAGMRSEESFAMSLRQLPVLAVALVLFSSAACSRDPEVAKKRHLDAGNAYFRAAKYREAHPRVPDCRSLRRGLRGRRICGWLKTYERTADMQNAYREYVRAADLLPDRAEVQVKAGNFLLVAGRFEDAKARAEQVAGARPEERGRAGTPWLLAGRHEEARRRDPAARAGGRRRARQWHGVQQSWDAADGPRRCQARRSGVQEGRRDQRRLARALDRTGQLSLGARTVQGS